MKNLLKILSWVLAWFLLVIWAFSAFSAWSSDETTWAESDFEDWKTITNNMISAITLWYVKNSSWNKIYWRKFSNSTSDWINAWKICANYWMTLPTNITRDLMYRQNHTWIDHDWTVKNWRSMQYNWGRHWGRNTNARSSSDSQRSFLFYRPNYPSYSGWSSTSNWYFNNDSSARVQTICVYKN